MGNGNSVLNMSKSKLKSNRKIKFIENNKKNIKLYSPHVTPPPGIKGQSLRMWNSPRPQKNINK